MRGLSDNTAAKAFGVIGFGLTLYGAVLAYRLLFVSPDDPQWSARAVCVAGASLCGLLVTAVAAKAAR